MMLQGLLRARGLRGLLELPSLFRFVRDLRRLSEEFVTLFAAFKAGTRTRVPPNPSPPRKSGNPRPHARPQCHAGRTVLARPPASPDRDLRYPQSRGFRDDSPACPWPLRRHARSPRRL